MNRYCIEQVDRLPENTEGADVWIMEGIFNGRDVKNIATILGFDPVYQHRYLNFRFSVWVNNEKVYCSINIPVGPSIRKKIYAMGPAVVFDDLFRLQKTYKRLPDL